MECNDSDNLHFALCNWRVTLDARLNMPVNAYNAMVDRHLIEVEACDAALTPITPVATIEVK